MCSACAASKGECAVNVVIVALPRLCRQNDQVTISSVLKRIPPTLDNTVPPTSFKQDMAFA